MAAGFGSSAPFPVRDRPSASLFRPDLDSISEKHPGGAPEPALTVLLVEDNSTDLFVIKEVLAQCKLNARLQIARDGQSALSYLHEVANDNRKPCPELMLLDLNLPGVAGIEVLKAVRNGPRCNRLPVIVVTSSDSTRDREAVEELGADAYFRKPTSLDAYFNLADVIRRVLRSHKGPE